MAELHIKATITKIAQFERDSGKSLMDALGEANFSLATLIDLVRATSGATDDEIDSYVEEHGVEALAKKLTEAFKKSGFLAKEKTPQKKQ